MLGNFYMMVGLPGSGKTEYAKKIKAISGGVLLSSDSIREELYGDESIQLDHGKVFEIMHKRANKYLSQGTHVIYDATNTNRKRRIHLLRNVIKANRKAVFYMNVNHDTCVDQDGNRVRSVGEEVIGKMYKSMQIPLLNEGWDKVTFVDKYDEGQTLDNLRLEMEDHISSNLNHEELMNYLSDCYYEFQEIYDLPQDSKYHSFSVSRHTFQVYKYIKNLTSDLELLYATLFHDLGKSYCKTFKNYRGEESKYAHYYGHEYVSSQIAANILSELGYNRSFTMNVSALCQFHMYPISASEKKMKQINRLLGDTLFEKLMLLHEADKQAK